MKYALIDSEQGVNSFARETTDEVNDLSAKITQLALSQKALSTHVRGSYSLSGDPTGDPTGAVSTSAIGDFIKAAVRGRTDDIVEMGGRPGSFVTKADLGTPLVNDSTTGSYLVPVQYAAEFLRVMEGQSELKPLVREWEMTSRTLVYPRKGTAPAFTQVASDGADNTEANPTFETSTLTARDYIFWIGLSEALLEDSSPNLGQYFRDVAAEAAATTFDQELLTSASTPTGLLVDSGTNAVSMGAGSIGFADLTFQNFLDLEAELATVKGALRGAKWIMSPSTWNIVRAMVDDNGNPLHGAWSDAAARQLLGYGVVLSYEMPDVDDSAADTAFIAFGNPQYLNWGNRIDLEVKIYDATSYSVTNCEVLIRARCRWAFDVGLPGAFAVLSTAAV